MQSNLSPMFFRLQAFNGQSSDESILWLVLKSFYSIFMFLFIVKCLSMFYSVSRKSCFLKHKKKLFNAASRWCPSWCQKRNFGLLRLGKNMSILRCLQELDLVLNSFSDITDGNWIHFTFTSLSWWILVHGCSGWVFLVCRSSFKLEMFSYCTFTETFALGFQIRFDHELIDFRDFVGICLVSSLYNQRRLKFATFAKIRFFLTTSINSDSLFEGILLCSLNLPVLLSHTIL